MTFISQLGTLEALRMLNGAGVEISEIVTGVPQLDLSTSEASQITFVVSDPTLALLGSGIFGLGTGIDYLDLKFEVAVVSTSGGSGAATVSITGRSRGVQALKGRKGALVIKNASPADWVRREAESAGLRVLAQPSPAIPQITRTEPKAGETGEKESSWDVIGRLAEEVGYVAYESGGVLYFGKPSWLITRPELRPWTVRYPSATADGELSSMEVPECRRTADATPPVTVSVSLSYEEGVRVRPGDKVALRGVPTFEADYIVTSVPIAIDGVSSITIEMATPLDPVPRPKKDETEYKEDPLAALPAGTSDIGPLDEAAIYDFGWPCEGWVSRKFEEGKHGGIDVAWNQGTRVVAARDGVVKYVGQAIEDPKFVKVNDARHEIMVPNPANHGLTVEIEHDSKWITRYQHLDKFVVKKGDKVKRGQHIGFMGTTGLGGFARSGPLAANWAPGDPDLEEPSSFIQPRLHFETRETGTPRDPEGMLPPRDPPKRPPTPAALVSGPRRPVLS